ncbi:thiamine metabolism [Scheffersomyces amazonensis]|uniref:thiamine metabolism n=1 Tax=Scheffersomyces amazonensis TaxID=1078765 RepID=UPI00315CE654
MTSIFKKLQVKPDGDIATVDFLRNRDLIPMGPPRRLWGYQAFFSYWTLVDCCIVIWAAAASLLSIGLNVKETIGIVIIGNCIVATLSCLNSAPGYYYHIGFTVSQRILFGIRGSYFGIAMRTILSIVWYASQAWLGGLCLGLIFSCFSKKYLYMENTFPESVHMSTRDFISFLIFHLISIPILCIKPEKITHFLKFAAAATFFGMLGTFIWAINKGGLGPLVSAPSNFETTADHAWAWIYGITSWVGSISAGITNSSDFTRFSKTRWVSIAPTTISLLVMGTIIPVFGILSGSATTAIYGEAIWQPNKIAEKWLLEDYSATSRAGAFFAGVSFLCSQLALNLVGNGIAGGMDMAGLFPHYINVRRGALVTALVSWVIQPWLFYNTSSTFVVVMASFSIFMAPIIGILVSEFWIIRRKHLKLSDLYSMKPSGNYWYWKGINVKSYVIFFIVSTPALPGLIHGANPNIKISKGLHNYYNGNCIFGFFIAVLLNLVISYIFPAKGIHETDDADYFDTFTKEECEELGIIPYSEIDHDADVDVDVDVDIVSEIVSPYKESEKV